MSNIFIGLKKTCLGVLGVLDRGERDKDNETYLKEERSHRNVNYSAPCTSGRDARSLRFELLTFLNHVCCYFLLKNHLLNFVTCHATVEFHGWL